MQGIRPAPVQSAAADFCFAPDLLPGAVVSAVGYASHSPAPQLHRGLPSPYLTFLFALDAPLVSASTPGDVLGARADSNEVLIAGLHSDPTYVLQPTTQMGIQLAVHPLASRSIFGVPAADVPWQATEGSDLLGAAACRVREQLAEQTSWPNRFEILARYLRQQYDDTTAVRPELAEAWAWLARRHGSGSIVDLARHVALSPRQLRTLFAAEVGVGPKHVGRLMRFDAAKRRLATATATGGRVALDDLAQRCGYYDQPHFTAEFRRFAGTSPTQWIAEERRNIQAGGHGAGAEWNP